MVDEGPAAGAARDAAGPTGVPPPEVCSLLRWAAATAGARHVVEIGSGAGVSGLWLLEGMAERAVLTSIEPEASRHELATAAYDDAGVARHVRAILGDPSEVIGRLSEATYELCVLQDGVDARLLSAALPLLKDGGMAVLIGVDPADRSLRDTLDADGLTAAILPLDPPVALLTVSRS